jgi:hypothetical protein
VVAQGDRVRGLCSSTVGFFNPLIPAFSPREKEDSCEHFKGLRCSRELTVTLNAYDLMRSGITPAARAAVMAVLRPAQWRTIADLDRSAIVQECWRARARERP